MICTKRLLSAVTAVSIAVFIQAPGLAKTLDLLQSVPLEVSTYGTNAAQNSAEQIITLLNGSDNLLLHMETLRHARQGLSPSEQEKLLTMLHARHRGQQNEPYYFFDHGYAQLVLKENKSGLFFLRKANDRLKNQFSALAYAMAQAEVDVNQEATSPDVMTPRKLDVTFLLKDAVNRDASNHQPGFWPTYVRVIEQLKPLAAYSDFARTDFSLAYLPYGNSVVPLHNSSSISLPLSTNVQKLYANAEHTACNPDAAGENSPVNGAPVATRSAVFSGTSALIQFFNTTEKDQYRVRVLGQDGFPMLSFTSRIMPSIVEDLDADGTYEIVVRQYKHDPLHPVIVYRATPCGFELDRTVRSYFQ